MTKLEREVIELSAQLKTILSIFESQKIKVDKTYKTVFENGLSSRVEEMHGWMDELRKEREQERTADAKTESEIKVLGFKTKSETRQGVVIGFVAGLIQVVLFLLTRVFP